MPINDAQRFNERTNEARAMADLALWTATAILRTLRNRELLSAEDEAAIVAEAAEAAGPSGRENARAFIADRLAPQSEPR